MQKYFYHYQGNSFGPYSKDELLSMSLPEDTQIWDSHIEKWAKKSEISELNASKSFDICEKPINDTDWFKYLNTGKNSFFLVSKFKKYNLSFWVMTGLLIGIFISYALTYQHLANHTFQWTFNEFFSILGIAGASFVLRTATFVASLIFIITLLEIIYFTWRILEFDNPSISASRAIGFLFIPFFNIWWAYFIITQSSQEILKFAKKRNISNIQVINEKLVISTAILAMLFLIPIIGFIVLIPFLIVQYIYMQKMAENAIELYRYVERNRPN